MSEKIRYKTRDIAFVYRMGAGFPGDVNRTHPASISPELIDTTNPPVAYGYPVLVDATSHNVRSFLAADHSDATPVAAFGVTVRPYPFQQQATTNYGAVAVGAGTPPTSGVIDILRAGYIMSTLPSGQSAVKGGTVYVWCAASSGVHVLGGIESVFSSGNTVALNNAVFNGVQDQYGNVEISFNV